jgi:subtilisin-like proprotein convertase family protein
VSLSSYIEFKRLSLAHIFEQMGSQEHEQENLETQSSLDNDDERSNSTTGHMGGAVGGNQ